MRLLLLIRFARAICAILTLYFSGDGRQILARFDFMVFQVLDRALRLGLGKRACLKGVQGGGQCRAGSCGNFKGIRFGRENAVSKLRIQILEKFFIRSDAFGDIPQMELL